ncbi:unnamed protein product [Clonostachys rhizophaga]|uniref:SMP-30/Gluconolactonase/LRE-like region domain-containing protein n=1 Tax=Clonostachys rhizophaga TaxID=160324 RepID=A0A9N9V917_9HYPO|nr:unnamed protein product [Clonostachys rhizophaga]
MSFGLDAWYQPPPTVNAQELTTLPTTFRRLGLSEHSQNQKRGRPLDSFLEGPFVRGNSLYLTDIPYGRIFAVDLLTKEWSLVIEYDGEPHGLAWHEQRQQIIIADFKQGVLALDAATKKISTVMNRFNGERLKGPNDLVITQGGSIIFTDQGMSSLQDSAGRVYRIQPDGRTDICFGIVPLPTALSLMRPKLHYLWL